MLLFICDREVIREISDISSLRQPDKGFRATLIFTCLPAPPAAAAEASTGRAAAKSRPAATGSPATARHPGR